jgi:hypothetical protein
MKFLTTFSPRFNQNIDSIIYHYCSDFVLSSICSNQELWLSDIYSMKDSAEFEWGREMFKKVLRENKNEFYKLFRYYIINVVTSAVPDTLPLIASFSRNGDLLSQWRAYAENGTGYSIGFDSNFIFKGLGVNINRVVYEEQEQYKLILNTLKGLHTIWTNSEQNFKEIQTPSHLFSIDLAYFKHPSFFEEQEVRIVRLLIKKGEGYKDPGGNSEINKIKSLNVLTRKREEIEVKYIKLPIMIRDSIREVVIGPRNRKSIEQVKELLYGFRLSEISVKKSNSTYR